MPLTQSTTVFLWVKGMLSISCNSIQQLQSYVMFAILERADKQWVQVGRAGVDAVPTRRARQLIAIRTKFSGLIARCLTLPYTYLTSTVTTSKITLRSLFSSSFTQNLSPRICGICVLFKKIDLHTSIAFADTMKSR